MQQQPAQEHDAIPRTTVAVVGAGFAGLRAARELRRHGVEVIVLEAADRPGGRAMSETTALGSRVDLGGQWIGHDHHRVTSLAAELGLTKFPMHTGRLPVIVEGARRITVGGPAMLGAVAALVALEALSRTALPRKRNDVTVSEWLRHVPGRTIRRLLEVIATTSWTADLDRFSVDAMARMIRSQGGLRTMLSTRGGAQDSLLVEGMGSLADALAAELGDRVRLGHGVESIVADGDGVLLRTARGEIRAEKAIVTVPPPMLERIDFDPALPAAHTDLARNTYMGSVYKAIAVYDRPFWRTGPGGEFLVLDTPGRAAFDTTPPGGPGHLCILVPGPEAHRLDDLDDRARRDAVLRPLALHLGPELLEPVSWHEKSWHRDEFVGGGYFAVPLPGTTVGFPPVTAEPTGDIHWAGTETAGDHPGYIEGALESGTRAAAEVLRALSRQ
ncbi:flavin monoamine oxidase family protein [Nocardia sp. NPDC057668]|uniref:flavin monoamine oxidase family protein n=1 Tax=Nocardia sp. NPDC057668 TaxID=3346202 RepID=UPI00366DC8A8